jgi:hypothetical protein
MNAKNQTTKADQLDTLREKLADIEHQRWADWQKWCNAVIREHIDSPKATEARLKLWDKQIATPYKDLTEQEKDSDREQVDRYLPLLIHWSERLVQDRLNQLQYKLQETIFAFTKEQLQYLATLVKDLENHDE